MVEEKVGEGKTRSDAVNPARPGQKPGCNPLTFFLSVEIPKLKIKQK